MFFCSGQAGKCSEVPPFFCLGINFSGIQTVLTRFKFLYHNMCLIANSIKSCLAGQTLAADSDAISAPIEPFVMQDTGGSRSHGKPWMINIEAGMKQKGAIL
jgi:hypothetical protein